jgi:hypothetical protein
MWEFRGVCGIVTRRDGISGDAGALLWGTGVWRWRERFAHTLSPDSASDGTG